MCEARSTSTLPEYHGGSCSWPGFGWTASDRPPGTTRFLICEGVSQYSDEPDAAEGGEERLQVAFGEGWRRQGWGLEGRCGHGEEVIDRLLGSGPRHRHAPLEGGQELIGAVDARELLRGELGRVASHQLAVGAGDLFGGGRGRQSQDVVRSFQGHLSPSSDVQPELGDAATPATGLPLRLPPLARTLTLALQAFDAVDRPQALLEDLAALPLDLGRGEELPDLFLQTLEMVAAGGDGQHRHGSPPELPPVVEAVDRRLGKAAESHAQPLGRPGDEKLVHHLEGDEDALPAGNAGQEPGDTLPHRRPVRPPAVEGQVHGGEAEGPTQSRPQEVQPLASVLRYPPCPLGPLQGLEACRP